MCSTINKLTLTSLQGKKKKETGGKKKETGEKKKETGEKNKRKHEKKGKRMMTLLQSDSTLTGRSALMYQQLMASTKPR